NGASVSASRGGVCVDTSMGLTPLEGLIKGTRSGDVDPAIVQFMTNHEGCTVDETLNTLNKKSGMLALSGGLSSDFRDIEEGIANGNERAVLAMETYCYHLAKYVGSYITALGGADAIVFTAGVGEHRAGVRRRTLDYLKVFGVRYDEALNQAACEGDEMVISTSDSAITVAVIPTNEELAIARDTLALVR
ncbi:MAG: acetate kinase, partial [Lachnospiraceae bacterium]|nr:acetate kinase [Lachnospiraceae bacterium]